MNLRVRFPVTTNEFEYYNKLKNDIFSLYPKLSGLSLTDKIFNVEEYDNEIENNYFEFVNKQSFSNFINRHKSVKYDKVFKIRELNTKKDLRQLSNHAINQVHIKSGFQLILFRVITKELIGCNKNKKKILKTLQNLLTTSKTEPINLKNLINNLNISTITWVKKEVQKITLVTRFIKWLFDYFICVILRFFVVTYIKMERIFIPLGCWSRLKKVNVKNLVAKNILVVCNEWNVNEIKNELSFFPKKKNLRCIIKPTYTKKEKEELKKVSKILQLLRKTTLRKNSSFQVNYKEIINTYNKNDNVYMILADIRNAYGSIDQGKLLNLLNHLLRALPKILLSDKDHIIQLLEDYISSTKIKFKNKVYNMCKGIAQGLPLSAILCDIYYSHMCEKHFSDFEKSGSLFYYVDDSFYITNNKEKALDYLKKVERGIPEYNCWFHKLKFESNKNCSQVEYLGWKLNTQTLEVEPKYKAARYSIIYHSINASEIKKKLENTHILKLHKLILHKDINSLSKIIENIECIFIQHAKYCFAILCTLDTTNTEELYLKSIRTSNLKICKKINTLTNWNKSEQKEHSNKIKFFMWRSFYKTFRSRCRFDILCKKFKEFTNYYDKRAR